MSNIIERKEAENIRSIYYCGKCNTIVDSYKFDIFKMERYNYCPHCGTKLDWNDIKLEWISK